MAANLKRRLRGYDRQQTDELLAQAAKSYERLRLERDGLAETLETLASEHNEREAGLHGELEDLKRQLANRDRQLAGLESRLGNLSAERAKRAEELRRAADELAGVRAAHEAQRADLAEQQESIARLRVREHALVEQLAILKGQLAQEALQDQLLELLEQETRRQAELAMERTRTRADEHLQPAEAPQFEIEGAAEPPEADEREWDEFDPLAHIERVDAAGSGEVGEAIWTSRPTLGEAPEG